MFSGIVTDHAHEQNNASVKGDSGGVGLTENPAALRRWMVTGPEMARLIGEFEVSTMKKKKTDFRHHEQTKHAQMAFRRDITSLTAVMAKRWEIHSPRTAMICLYWIAETLQIQL